jgi:uncharacterized coiled-coil DUF342 family protein
MMQRAGKLLTILAVAALGLWGCAKNPANPGDQADGIHKLEKKCAALEKDSKALAAARDEAAKKAAALEDDSKQLQQQLKKEQEARQQLAKERDDLRQQIESRTGERDALQTRCDRMKKGLQNLLGQDDAYLASPPQVPPSTQVLGN